MKRWLVRLLSIAVVGFCAVIGVSWWSDHATGDNSLNAAVPKADLVARGAYLAKLGDCAACHSIAKQPAFSGGLRMMTPIGAIYSSNITPDKEKGIGNYSLVDFDRALRFGVAGGHTLYPAMPFTSYYSTTPDDVAALYAYFQLGVAPAAVPNRRNEIPFPLSMRWPLTYWRWFFAPRPTPFVPASGADPLMQKGAYFVDGLGHCGECHTPRGIAMQVKARSAGDGASYLAGGVIDNLFAPSLRNDTADSIAGWAEKDIAAFLQRGTNSSGIAFGSMSDVIVHSTQFMTDEDALAAARYLKSVGVSTNPAIRFVYDETAHTRFKQGDASQRGAQLYLDNCAACHRPDGRGYEGVFPSLAGNPIVQAPDPLSLIAIVMDGSTTARTKSTPAQFTMPAFAWRLSSLDVADVLTFIRTSWGNAATPVNVPQVESHRALALGASKSE
jgi:mono/diheme cytochrome c family protein